MRGNVAVFDWNVIPMQCRQVRLLPLFKAVGCLLHDFTPFRVPNPNTKSNKMGLTVPFLLDKVQYTHTHIQTGSTKGIYIYNLGKYFFLLFLQDGR